MRVSVESKPKPVLLISNRRCSGVELDLQVEIAETLSEVYGKAWPELFSSKNLLKELIHPYKVKIMINQLVFFPVGSA